MNTASLMTHKERRGQEGRNVALFISLVHAGDYSTCETFTDTAERNEARSTSRLLCSPRPRPSSSSSPSLESRAVIFSLYFLQEFWHWSRGTVDITTYSPVIHRLCEHETADRTLLLHGYSRTFQCICATLCMLMWLIVLRLEG